MPFRALTTTRRLDLAAPVCVCGPARVGRTKDTMVVLSCRP